MFSVLWLTFQGIIRKLCIVHIFIITILLFINVADEITLFSGHFYKSFVNYNLLFLKIVQTSRNYIGHEADDISNRKYSRKYSFACQRSQNLHNHNIMPVDSSHIIQNNDKDPWMLTTLNGLELYRQYL